MSPRGMEEGATKNGDKKMRKEAKGSLNIVMPLIIYFTSSHL